MPHNVSLISTIAVGLGFALVLGFIVMRLRLPALVGYLLQQWRVDCSPDARLDPHSHPLRLANPELVATLANCRLLPGVAP